MNDKKNREPMVIALATGKGGSMKTTSAVFLACALVDQSRGEQHVLVADADVQGDAKDWWYRAAELDDPLPFDVMSAAPADITHLRGINDRLDDPRRLGADRLRPVRARVGRIGEQRGPRGHPVEPQPHRSRPGGRREEPV